MSTPQPADATEVPPNHERCPVSSWRVPLPKRRVSYENVFGPGGYNRCVLRLDTPHERHEDAFGNVFLDHPFRVLPGAPRRRVAAR